LNGRQWCLPFLFSLDRVVKSSKQYSTVNV
jgi:hypothetical protein